MEFSKTAQGVKRAIGVQLAQAGAGSMPGVGPLPVPIPEVALPNSKANQISTKFFCKQLTGNTRCEGEPQQEAPAEGKTRQSPNPSTNPERNYWGDAFGPQELHGRRAHFGELNMSSSSSDTPKTEDEKATEAQEYIEANLKKCDKQLKDDNEKCYNNLKNFPINCLISSIDRWKACMKNQELPPLDLRR